MSKKGSCLYYSDPANLNKINICDPEKLDCYLAHPFFVPWTNNYLFGNEYVYFNDTLSSLTTKAARNEISFHALFYYFSQFPEEINSVVAFYNKMMYESQIKEFVNFTIGWRCTYTLKKNKHKFISTLCINAFKSAEIINDIYPITPVSFCASMCCFRKAFFLKGWFWQLVQFSLRFFQQRVKLFRQGSYDCPKLLKEKKLNFNPYNTSNPGVPPNCYLFNFPSTSISIPQIISPDLTIMFSTFDNQNPIKNCSCLINCALNIVDPSDPTNTLEGDAPWGQDVFGSDTMDMCRLILPWLNCCNIVNCCGGPSKDCIVTISFTCPCCPPPCLSESVAAGTSCDCNC